MGLDPAVLGACPIQAADDSRQRHVVGVAGLVRLDRSPQGGSRIMVGLFESSQRSTENEFQQLVVVVVPAGVTMAVGAAQQNLPGVVKQGDHHSGFGEQLRGVREFGRGRL